MTHKTLSIVSPVFEEEEGLLLFHEELRAALDPLEDQFAIEVIYVDDGSADGTLAVIKEIAFVDRRVRYLSLSRNFGHQAALTAGLEQADGDVVITLDSDLQHPPGLIAALLDRWRQGFDVVQTVRLRDPHESWLKRVTSRWFYRLMALASETEIRPGATDYRLLSRRAVDALLQIRETHRFLRGLVPWLGFSSAEVPFVPRCRAVGRSKFGFRRLCNLAVDALYSFSRLPPRLLMAAGVAALLVGLGVALFGLVRWLRGPTAFEIAWTFLAGSLYALGGAILAGLGLIGEYLSRIFEQVKARPLYLVKESSPEQARARLVPARRTASSA